MCCKGHQSANIKYMQPKKNSLKKRPGWGRTIVFRNINVNRKLTVEPSDLVTIGYNLQQSQLRIRKAKRNQCRRSNLKEVSFLLTGKPSLPMPGGWRLRHSLLQLCFHGSMTFIPLTIIPYYDLLNPTASSSSTVTLIPPSETPVPTPTHKQCPSGTQRSPGYMPRPPNAFTFFCTDKSTPQVRYRWTMAWFNVQDHWCIRCYSIPDFLFDLIF